MSTPAHRSLPPNGPVLQAQTNELAHPLRVRRIGDTAFLRVSLGGLAVGAVVGAIAAALDGVLEHAEHRLLDVSANAVATWSFTTLGVVAGLVGVVFSLTMVTLTLASQQFGPRIIRIFLRDRAIKTALSVFMGLWSLSAITAWSASRSRAPSQMPLSMVALLGWGAVAAGALILFFHHLAQAIQIPHVTASIAADLNASVQDLLQDSSDHAEDPELLIVSKPYEITSTSSGFCQHISESALVAAASQVDATVELEIRPGDFVIAGTVVARSTRSSEALVRAVDKALHLGTHRTETQDVAFANDQLVEIALRAMSPAINDPITAMNCLGWLGNGVGRAFELGVPTRQVRDDTGAVRVIRKRFDASEMVAHAFDPIRQVAKTTPMVTLRHLQVLGGVATHVTTERQLDALAEQVELMCEAAQEFQTHEYERARIEEACSGAHDAVAAARVRLSERSAR